MQLKSASCIKTRVHFLHINLVNALALWQIIVCHSFCHFRAYSAACCRLESVSVCDHLYPATVQHRWAEPIHGFVLAMAPACSWILHW